MRCCVPGCKNDSRHMSKSKGITFHVFPSKPTLQVAWLRAVGKDPSKPHKRSAVCSEHFLCDDLYETKNGMRKVRTGAVPIFVQDSGNCGYGTPASLKVCRICLVTDSKLFPIRKYKLDQAYEDLTGSPVSAEDKLPQKLCYECAQRLLNCSRFRTKSLRAASLMLEVVKKQDHLTIQNLKSISRLKNQLVSTLAPKHLGSDHYDYLLEDDRSEKKEDVPSPISSEVFLQEFEDSLDVEDTHNESLDYSCTKCVKIFLDQDDYYSHMASHDEFLTQLLDSTTENQTENFAPKFNENDTQTKKETDDLNQNLDSKLEYKFNVKTAEHIEEEFVATEEDYTTDDSVLLEEKREKKLKKRAEKKNPEPKIDRRRKPFLSDDLNETLFTVTDLTYDEQVAEIEKRQESSNYKNAVFKCTECYKGFLDEDAYNSHMLRHTEKCGEHRCPVCKIYFKNSHASRNHIKSRHAQRFSCKKCPYVAAHRQAARMHERWHKGTKYECPHCPDTFLKFTTYMGHVRIKHPSDFVCQLCGYSFVSERGIALHKTLKHRHDNAPIPDDGPQCELCNIRFRDSEALKRHISVSARHSSVEKGLIENKLPKRKKSRKSKEGDKRAKNRREIPCEQCGLLLEDWRAYSGHFRRMHPDKNRTKYPTMKAPSMCEVCGKIFKNNALLKYHRRTHTGERQFKCDSCEKSFHMKQNLVQHRRVHSAQKARYTCEACGKHFSSYSNRYRHMFIHSGLKPFKCDICGKGFVHPSEKRAHVNYVHLKKPWPKRSRGKRRPDRLERPDAR